MFSPGNGRRDSRLSARLAQAAAKPTLRAVSKCLALFSRANALFPLQGAVAPVYPLASCAWLARSPRSTAAHAAFPRQFVARRSQSLDDTRAHERVFKLSLSIRRKTCLRPDHHIREPARRENVRALRV